MIPCFVTRAELFTIFDLLMIISIKSRTNSWLHVLTSLIWVNKVHNTPWPQGYNCFKMRKPSESFSSQSKGHYTTNCSP